MRETPGYKKVISAPQTLAGSVPRHQQQGLTVANSGVAGLLGNYNVVGYVPARSSFPPGLEGDRVWREQTQLQQQRLALQAEQRGLHPGGNFLEVSTLRQPFVPFNAK